MNTDDILFEKPVFHCGQYASGRCGFGCGETVLVFAAMVSALVAVAVVTLVRSESEPLIDKSFDPFSRVLQDCNNWHPGF